MKTDTLTILFNNEREAETLEFTSYSVFKGWASAPEGLYLFSNTTTYLHPWHRIHELRIHAPGSFRPVKS